MRKLGLVGLLINIFLVIPIWYTVLYRILDTINADTLTWFLFWVYVPAGLLTHAITKIIEADM